MPIVGIALKHPVFDPAIAAIVSHGEAPFAHGTKSLNLCERLTPNGIRRTTVIVLVYLFAR